MADAQKRILPKQKRVQGKKQSVIPFHMDTIQEGAELDESVNQMSYIQMGDEMQAIKPQPSLFQNPGETKIKKKKKRSKSKAKNAAKYEIDDEEAPSPFVEPKTKGSQRLATQE